MVASINPPEERPYSSIGERRVLRLVSSNAKKYFHNREKHSIILLTSMPGTKEGVEMTQVLWDGKKTPRPWRLDTLCSMDEKMSEVEKRKELVGAILRLFCWSTSFERAMSESARCNGSCLRDACFGPI